VTTDTAKEALAWVLGCHKISLLLGGRWEKKGGMTGWTGYQDNHSHYLGWPFTKHYCRAASAGSTLQTNDLRYGHIRIMMNIDIDSSQIMAGTQLNI
jgi:hypothetical protein